MNCCVGDNAPSWAGAGATWTQFKKTTDLRTPASIYTFLDEHPDSINDGWFCFATPAGPTETAQWSDMPASYHDGACGFAFADGHSEIHRWLSANTQIPVHYNTSAFPALVGPDNRDINWVAKRTTYHP